MPKQIKYGQRTIIREEFSRAKEIFTSPDLLSMIDKQLDIAEKHAAEYPVLDKARTVTIKLSLKPLAKIKSGELHYNDAVFTAEVASPSLPTTSVPFNCAVSNGKAYFNIHDPENPMQLTFRDGDMEGVDADNKTVSSGA